MFIVIRSDNIFKLLQNITYITPRPIIIVCTKCYKLNDNIPIPFPRQLFAYETFL